MIEKYSQTSRKTVEEDRIAICPQFGCKHLEKVKPLKFGVLGFRKYPKCSKHKLALVFVDEFIENFIQAVNACLFDKSSLPPKNLINLIKINAPNGLDAFINGWMYSNPLGMGAQIVSHYIDGLSRSYMKLLSRKQRKSLQVMGDSKKRVRMLRLGLKKIAEEYTNFLQNLREKDNLYYNPKELCPFSDVVRNIIKTWLIGYLNKIQITKNKKTPEKTTQNKSLSTYKMEYDKILHAGTCTLLLGKSPTVVTKGISAFELFSAYHEFLKNGLSRELKPEDIDEYFKQFYLKIKHPKIGSLEWNSIKDRISEEILVLAKKNKKKLLESLVLKKDDREFFLLIIKEIFLLLKNNTDLLNSLNYNQLKNIPLSIYDVVKDIYLIRSNFHKEAEFIERINNLYGFIYLGVNLASRNKKVYVGQTILTIEEEWGNIIAKGNTLRKKRQENPNQSISARYILNAIAKYGSDVWDLKLIDIAYKKSELDNKERYYIMEVYDSMNPEKGYNLTTGGRTGGRLSPATKKKVSESVQNVWNSPGYRERLGKAQSKSWESEERREKNIKGLLKSWENEERRQRASEQAFKRWEDEEMKIKMKLGMSKSAKKIWQNPTEAMLKSLNNMHQNMRKDIVNLKEFLIDIKITKNQREFWQGDLFKKYGIKSHMTLNSRIKEILGGFGVNNHGEAHRFFYDRSIDEVLNFLDNPKGYNIFRDPFTKHFFIDVKNSKKGVDLHKKYRVWHKQGLIRKIKRIVGKFGINNYTSLKMLLQEKGINQSLKYFENLE